MEETREPVQYGALYREGREYLAALPEAALDARLLLEEACGTSLQTLLVSPERPVSAGEEARYRAWLQRRKNREPLAMILGHTGFMGLEFHVDRHVLIPEQDTEILVEEALREAKADFRTIAAAGAGSSEGRPGQSRAAGETPVQQADPACWRVLDLCTGSGCIVLSLLHYLLQGKCPCGLAAWAADLSPEALQVARENAVLLGWQQDGTIDERWTQTGAELWFRQGDLFGALKRQEDRQGFHMIVSNPPYIPENVIPTLVPEVREGEPRMALSGGTDGLDFYRRIAREAGQWLLPGGRLLLEIGYDQGKTVPALLREAGFEQIRVLQDYGGRDRVVVCRAPGNWIG